MKAVVTAGGRIEGDYAAAARTHIKALARVRGRTMLDAVLEALRDAGATRIAVVGSPEVAAACSHLVERVVGEGISGAQNVQRALDAWPDDDGQPLLYATSDLPYVTGDAVASFVQRVPAGNVAIALSEYNDFELRFPHGPPFGITLAGERVVNGGVFSIPPGSCATIAAVAARFFDARKRPWKMATLISPIAMVRFALRRLSIAQLERAAHDALGVCAAGVRRCAPELAYDADTIDEYRYAVSNH